MARKKHVSHPVESLDNMIGHTAVGASSDTKIHPIILNSSTLINFGTSPFWWNPDIPVNSSHLLDTTTISPKEKSIAPTMPPIFRNIRDAIPILTPAKIALGLINTCYSIPILRRAAPTCAHMGGRKRYRILDRSNQIDKTLLEDQVC